MPRPGDNAPDVAARLRALAAATERRVRLYVGQQLLLAETQVKAGASGRPGPNVITGDYRRSINARTFDSGDAFGGIVGTNAPQGPRLEFGFRGPDRLGRVFNQPPFPHFGPVRRRLEGTFPAALAEIMREATR